MWYYLGDRNSFKITQIKLKMGYSYAFKSFIYLAATIAFFRFFALPIQAQILPKGFTLDPETVLLLQQGQSLFSRKNYQEALEKFAEAIARQPQAAVAYYQRGLVYAQYVSGKPFKPGATIPGCNRDRANTLIIYCDMRVALRWSEENRTKAIQDFTQAIQLNPDYAEAYHQRGLVQSENPQQVKDLQQAIALYYSQGIENLQQENHAAAASHFQQMNDLENRVNSLTTVSLEPQPEATTRTGNSGNSGEVGKAEQYVKEGNILLRRGDRQGALNQYKRAVSLFEASGKTERANRLKGIINDLVARLKTR